ncbi:heme-binding domain-containing protein [Edaphobacter bradus]|uniref:heme-binding domain-containing protein n=1 Tax=Edaphobacter bradus TaxID=2259016 RepID=UPI0021DF9FF6|nr:heme-binding domain-containing protein [Edaphobacter bradus]
MTRLRISAVCATALLSSLLLARVHPFGDAGLYTPNPSPAPIMEHSSVPPQVRDLLTAKCADCHSTQTRAPLYGRLAPISWFMERDILEGRKHMDLSAWDTYTSDQQQTLQAKIIQQTRAGKMPLPQYRNIHRNSAITAADLQLLTQWAHQSSPLATDPSQPLPTEGSAVQGKLVFEKRCTGCHSLAQNREGPNLSGVFGRTSGQAPGFTYSPALQNAHIVWNELTLDRWLTDPDAYLPGNNMDFHVAKPQERRDLIRFLKESAAPNSSTP